MPDPLPEVPSHGDLLAMAYQEVQRAEVQAPWAVAHLERANTLLKLAAEKRALANLAAFQERIGIPDSYDKGTAVRRETR